MEERSRNLFIYYNFMLQLDIAQYKKISIIVPVYNAERFLSVCLDSIFCQNFDKSCYEVICINDGSKDNSLSILNQYAELHTNLIIIDQANSGPASARNVGLKVAQYDYIWFVDSDDYVGENSLYNLSIGLGEPYDFLIFGYFVINENGLLINRGVNKYKKKKDLSGADLYIQNSIPSYPWNRVFSRTFLRDNHLTFDWDYPDDEEFLFRTYCLATHTHITNTPFYYYRIINTSYSRNINSYKKYVNGYLGMMEKLKPFSEKYFISHFWCKITWSNIRNWNLNLFKYEKRLNTSDKEEIRNFLLREKIVLRELVELYKGSTFYWYIIYLISRLPHLFYLLFCLAAKIKRVK